MGAHKREKPQLSFWQIWNMSFGFLGIQFGFGLQNANVSRIFETLGADIEEIPILWIAAPVTGLIVQPIIGYFSDRTWHPVLGRRRPYFLVGAILASIALVLMPNSPILWIAAGMLWILDASINISMEPFRAFVGDNLPSKQRTTGFAMQSFFIGVGAVVASALPYIFTNWLGVSNEAPKGIIPLSVKWSFYVGAVVFFLSVLWTVLRSREYSAQELASFEAPQDTFEKADLSREDASKRGKFQILAGSVVLLAGLLLALLFSKIEVEKQIYIFAFGLALIGALFIISGLLQRLGKYSNGFVTIINDLQDMPLTMKQLSLVQFFSWFALFCMWLYTTSGVTSDKYKMKVDREEAVYLTNLASQIQPEGEGDELEKSKKELEKVREKLEEMNKKFEKGKEAVVLPVTAANFFLNDKILSEKDIVEKVLPALGQLSGVDNTALEEGKKELDDIQKRHLDEIDGNEKVITFKTFELLFQNRASLWKDELPSIEQSLEKIHRLKYIQKEYNDGADWVGICFSVYNGFAAVFAFLLMYLAKRTNRKLTHFISLIVGSISFVSIFLINDIDFLLISFVGIGMAWASILAMPYAILTGSIPASKMGYYMGVFNFFIVIPQIIAATILGFLVSKVFDGEPIYISLVASGSLLLAALLTLRVHDRDDSTA